MLLVYLNNVQCQISQELRGKEQVTDFDIEIMALEAQS